MSTPFEIFLITLKTLGYGLIIGALIILAVAIVVKLAGKLKLLKAWRTFKKHPMLWFVPALLVKFFVVDFVLRFFFPNAATYDAGILHKISLTMLDAACFASFSFALLYVFNRSLYNYIDDRWFEKEPFLWTKRDTAAGCFLAVVFFCLCLLAA